MTEDLVQQGVAFDGRLTKRANQYLHLRQRRIEAQSKVNGEVHQSESFLYIMEAGLFRAAELTIAYRLCGRLATQEVAEVTPSIDNFDRYLPDIAKTVTAAEF